MWVTIVTAVKWAKVYQTCLQEGKMLNFYTWDCHTLGPTIGVPGGQDKLDPITIYETVKIKLMLSRDGLEVPDKEDVDGEEEDDDTYREWPIKVGVTAILDWCRVKEEIVVVAQDTERTRPRYDAEVIKEIFIVVQTETMNFINISGLDNEFYYYKWPNTVGWNSGCA